MAALPLMAAAAYAQPGPREITVVLKEDMDNLDPCNMSAAYVGNVLRQNVIEPLTVLDPEDSSPQPHLATSWEALPDGVWRFKLREGVKFHDGADFNAEAVAKSFVRMKSANLTCLDPAKARIEALGVNIVDPYTIELKPEPPRVLLPVLLSFIGITSPNKDDAAPSREPIGTGPFAFQSWDNDRIVLDRFEEYWGEKPEAERVNYTWRSESSLRAAMVDVGEADLALDIAPQDATKDSDKAFLSGDTTRLRMVMLPPLDDIRVRKAMNYAFDREALLGTLLSEHAVPATNYFLPKTVGYNPDLKVFPYDLEEAKKLIEEARADGVPVDAEIRLVGRIGLYPNGSEVLQAMAQMWSEIGLNIRIEMIETAQWLKLVNRPFAEERPVMLIQEQHDNNNGDAEFTMHSRFETGGRQSELSIPELDKVLTEAKEATGEERAQLYAEANRIVAEEVVPHVMMYHMASFVRVGPRISFDPSTSYAGLLRLSEVRFND